MVMPTKEKTWQFSVNSLCSDMGAALYNLKTYLQAFPLGSWTVWGSSTGARPNPYIQSYGNGDGIDRWDTSPYVVGAYDSIGAWIVLKNAGLGADVALCVQYAGWLAVRGLTAVLAPNGFNSNGGLTTRPTAPDELVLCEDAQTIGNTQDVVIHVLQSTDGEVMHWFRCLSGVTYGYVVVAKVKNPIAGWSPAVVAGTSPISSSGANANTYAYLNDTASVHGRVNGALCSCYLASTGWGGSTAGEQITFPDDDTGEYPLSPVTLVSPTPGGRGVKGVIPDVWWGSTAVASGGTYPNDGSRQFVQFAHMVFPWNGSVPLLA